MAATQKDEVIRVGVAGYGRSGCNIHTRWLREDRKRFRIVGVADGIAERRKEAREEWGCPVHKDYKGLLKQGDFDLLINALPNHLHVPGTVAGLKAGYHVVSEKPSGRTVKQFDRMVAAARQARRKLLPFQNSRFFAFFRKLREVLDSGVLGELLHARMVWGGFSRRWDWQTLQKYDAGNLRNTGPHPVDQAVVLLEGKTPKVCCQMKSIQPLGGDAEDYCNITLYGKHLPTIEILLSNFLAYPSGDLINLQCTYGGLAGGPAGLRWKYYDPKKAPRHKFWKPWSRNREYCGEKLPWCEKTWKPGKEDADSFLANSRAFYDNVYDVLAHGAAPTITHGEVRRQIAIIEECHKQNRLPKKVK